MSKGEDKVAALLQRGGIQFKREVSFPDLHGYKNNLLRFDFAIYRHGRLAVCLEIDGAQHFTYTPFFHKTKLAFKRQQEWDRQKNKYCLLHNIPLIRIPYWELEDLTLQKLLSEPSFRVKSKYHNDDLARRRGLK